MIQTPRACLNTQINRRSAQIPEIAYADDCKSVCGTADTADH